MARELGSIEHLLPKHVESIIDIPYTLAEAIHLATAVWSWRENLAHDEIPPRHIWLDGELVKEWFDEVERARERKYKGEGEGQHNEAADALVVG